MKRLSDLVAERCGDPQARFAAYGHLFGEWIESSPAGAVAEVEAGIGDYLGTAARVGRARGTAIGVLGGLAGAALAVLVVWVLS